MLCARSVDDLKGFSVQIGGGAMARAAVGAYYVAGLDTSSFANMVAGPTYVGVQLNAGAGFRLMIAEIHSLLGGSVGCVFGKETETWTAK